MLIQDFSFKYRLLMWKRRKYTKRQVKLNAKIRVYMRKLQKIEETIGEL